MTKRTMGAVDRRFVDDVDKKWTEWTAITFLGAVHFLSTLSTASMKSLSTAPSYFFILL